MNRTSLVPDGTPVAMDCAAYVDGYRRLLENHRTLVRRVVPTGRTRLTPGSSPRSAQPPALKKCER